MHYHTWSAYEQGEPLRDKMGVDSVTVVLVRNDMRRHKDLQAALDAAGVIEQEREGLPPARCVVMACNGDECLHSPL